MSDGRFPSKNSLRLRRTEAQLLQARYGALKPGGRDGLISHLVSLAQRQTLTELAGVDNVWDVPALPPEKERAVDHARRLSLFARGTTLQYHWMLIEKKGEDDTGAAEAFSAWWDAACADLAGWNLDDFFAHLQRWGANRRPVHDREFLSAWIARCAGAASGTAALHDRAARAIVQQREDRVRPGKQRLRVAYQLDAWQLPTYRADDYYQLSYRHPVGRQFAEDIADGLLRQAA